MLDHRFAAFAIALFTTAVIADARAEIRIGIAAPLTGPYAWSGEQVRVGADLALRELNQRGGVLGEPLVAVVADDFCDPEQALAAANKLVAEGVAVAVGHQCSGAAIPASAIYEDAGIVFITPAATNPLLTESGLRYTFRICGRDDVQGAMIAEHLAKAWRDASIAIVHDGQTYGRGIAEEAKRQLEERGIEPALFEQVQPGQTEFSKLVAALERHGIGIVFYGGYTAEAGLLARQAKARLTALGFVVPDGVATDDFPLIAGDAAEGILMTSVMDAAGQAAAADAVAAFRAAGIEPSGSELYAYAAVQVWAHAVEQSGTTDAARIAELLRNEQFESVLGRIGFDTKGDVYGYEPFSWYIWTDGKYVPKHLTD